MDNRRRDENIKHMDAYRPRQTANRPRWETENKPRNAYKRPIHLPRKKPAIKKKSTLPKKGKAELLLVTVVLLVLVCWLSWRISPLALVNYVKVEGNDKVSQEEIIETSGIRDFDPISSVIKNKPKIENEIKKQHPTIESVKINKNDWKYTSLQVTEADYIAYTNINDKTYLLARNGSLIELDGESDMSDKLFEVDANGQAGRLRTFAKNFVDLDPDISSRIKKVELSTDELKPNLLTLEMVDGNTVIGLSLDLPKKIKAYPKLLELVGNQKGVFNFEYSNYFIPYDNQQESIQLPADN